VAYEPDAYGATRFALLSNGEVIRLSAKELAGRVQNEFAMVEGKDGSL
jgi:hypothetical protein